MLTPRVAWAATKSIDTATALKDALIGTNTEVNNGDILALASDITVDTEFNPEYQIVADKNLTLDLNGHTLTMNKGSRFVINDNVSFTITDSSGGKSSILPTNRTREVFEFNGGSLTLTNLSSNNNASTQPLVKMGGANSTLTVTNCSFANNGVANDGEGPVINSNAGSVSISGSTFTNNKAYAGGAVFKKAGTLTIGSSSTFSGNTATQGGAVFISDGCIASIEGDSKLTNNTAAVGGALYVASEGTTLNINSGIINNNKATEDGGGIYAANGPTVNMTGGSIASNGAVKQGGGIRGWNCNISVSGGTVDGNSAGTLGGGVFLGKNDGTEANNHTLSMTDGTISNNTAEEQGGGICITEAVQATVSGGTISKNRAKQTGWGVGGGGIATLGFTTLKLTGGTISGNVAEGSGGGILANGSSFSMSGGTVDGNVAKLNEGGGITLQGGTGIITKGRITNNISGYDENGNPVTAYEQWGGGGIFISDNSKLMYMPAYTLVTGNAAGGFGGGVAACSTGRSYLLDTIAIYGNSAAGTNLSGSGSVKHDDHQYAADNPVFMANGYQDFYSALFSYVTNTMPGGYEQWTGSSDGEHVEVGTGANVIVSASTIGLTARGTSSLPESSFPVVITGNRSYTHGGGILNNGIVVYGEASTLNVGKALAIDATKMLLEEDGETDARLQLVADNADGTPTSQCAFEILDKDDNVISTGKVVNNFNGEDKLTYSEVVFDRRLTFDETNCKGTGPWSFTYYVRESSDAPGWMKTDDTIYRLNVQVQRENPGSIEIPDGTGNLTEYDYAIDFGNTTVETSTDGGKTWTSFSYSSNAGDKAHAATLSLWPTGGPEAYNSFVNQKQQVKRSLTVTKVWNDDGNRDALRKKVTIHLLRDGVDTGQTATLDTKDKATATFTDLDTYDLSTNMEYVYTIEEEVPEGYVATTKADGNGNITLTNTHAIVTTHIGVTKKWAGDSGHTSDRPSSVTIALLADGKEAMRAKVEAADDGTWSTTFSDLPANAEGKPIAYTVQEIDVDSHYTASVSGSAADGFVVTNTYKAGVTAQKLAHTADNTPSPLLFLVSEGLLLLAAASMLRN